MRPLRHAPAISRLIATLTLLTVLMALGLELWGDNPRIVSHILPISTVTVFPGVDLGVDRLILLGVRGPSDHHAHVPVRGAPGSGWRRARWPRTGTVPAMLGISPDIVAGANWGLGGGLAVVATILVVNVSGLNVTNLALLVVPGMAAALVGAFRSYWLTLAGGLLIGVLESEVAFLQTKVSNTPGAAGLGPVSAIRRHHRRAHGARARAPPQERGIGNDRQRSAADGCVPRSPSRSPHLASRSSGSACRPTASRLRRRPRRQRLLCSRSSS